ncbi:MAG: hypothetical protein M3O70_21250 [Actinomycetota bacterium]|nr:hypothetical protein [Actinomycetota bacterium]
MAEPALWVDFELPREVPRGHVVVARVTVGHRGEKPLTVSARLHPAEGDLSFRVRDPTGKDRPILGRYQVDSPPRPIELAPGAAVAAGVNLLAMDTGRVFEQPGVYRLMAVYLPSVRDPQIYSAPREAVVLTPREERDQSVAELLHPSVVDALALGDVDPGSPAETVLREVAALAPQEPSGALAALVVAASAARRGRGLEEVRRVVAGLDREALAWLVTAALPPAAGQNDPLVRATVEVLEPGESAEADRTLRMVRGEPFPAGR